MKTVGQGNLRPSRLLNFVACVLLEMEVKRGDLEGRFGSHQWVVTDAAWAVCLVDHQSKDALIAAGRSAQLDPRRSAYWGLGALPGSATLPGNPAVPSGNADFARAT